MKQSFIFKRYWRKKTKKTHVHCDHSATASMVKRRQTETLPCNLSYSLSNKPVIYQSWLQQCSRTWKILNRVLSESPKKDTMFAMTIRPWLAWWSVARQRPYGLTRTITRNKEFQVTETPENAMEYSFRTWAWLQKRIKGNNMLSVTPSATKRMMNRQQTFVLKFWALI